MFARRSSGKFISLLFAAAVCLSMTTPAMAAGTENSSETPSQNKTVLLADGNTIEPAVFSATIPTSLPIHVDGYGQVTSAANATITNNGNSTIKVVGLSIQKTDVFDIVGYDEDFSSKLIDSNQIALNINSLETQSDGRIIFDSSAFSAIPANGSYNLPYTAKVTASSTGVNDLHVANVVFTIDWLDTADLTYNANGGVFANSASTSVIKYTSDGKWIEGSVENPTRDNCTFDGWWTDTTYTTQFTGQPPTSNTTVWAKWLTEVTIQHCWQDLDNSYSYTLHETETITATVGQTIWPAPKTYDQYKTPSTQSLLVDASGNCTLVYKYDRTTYWLDVNYVIDTEFTGGPSDSNWPSALYMDFMSVYINGNYVGGGRDYCVMHPFDSYYSVTVNLPDGFYYAGTFNEGADYWQNGTTLYRRPASGRLTENIGIRLIINSTSKAKGSYSIAFNANGGEGTMENMTMYFGEGANGNIVYELKALRPNTFTKEGCTFGGWVLTADGENPVYTDGEQVSTLSTTDGDVITLYALWIPSSTFALRPGAEVEEDMAEETTAPDESEDESPEETDTTEPENTTPPSEDPEFSEGETEPPSEETTPSEPNKETDPTEGDSQKEQTPATPPNPSELPESSEPPANTEPPSEPPINESDDSNIPGDNLHQEESGNETEQDSEKPAEQPSVPTEPEGEESTDPGEGASEESQIEDSDDSELPKEEEKSLVEPVYYCGLDAHIHGEDCTNSTICEMEEHEHDSSCLTPNPSPEESKPEEETEPPTESEPSNEPIEEPIEEIPPTDGTESSDNTEDVPIIEKEPEPPPEPPAPPPEEQPSIEESPTPPTTGQEAESSEETS